MIRKITVLLSLLALLSTVPVRQAQAAQPGTEGYIQQLISYYRYYGPEASGDIQRVLEEMYEENPQEAGRWSAIMAGWRRINEEMPLCTGVLPDGLPEDDSLCIVVMGFKLESGGSMAPELISRLEVALESVKKYPNALVVCTGGATSQRRDVTEAGLMRNWLISAGVEKERILTETRAANTPQNAVFVYDLLQRSYPQVGTVAIVTSDYHIYRSMTLFCAQALLKDLQYDVSANAVCATDMAGERELEKQANNLAELASVRLADVPRPELHILPTETMEQTEPTEVIPEETAPVQTVQTEVSTQPQESAPEPTAAAEEHTQKPKVPVFALAGFAGALLLALLLTVILIRISRPGRR